MVAASPAGEPGRRALGERGGRRAEATFAWDAAAGYEDALRRAATRARPGAAVVQR